MYCRKIYCHRCQKSRTNDARSIVTRTTVVDSAQTDINTWSGRFDAKLVLPLSAITVHVSVLYAFTTPVLLLLQYQSYRFNGTDLTFFLYNTSLIAFTVHVPVLQLLQYRSYSFYSTGLTAFTVPVLLLLQYRSFCFHSVMFNIIRPVQHGSKKRTENNGDKTSEKTDRGLCRSSHWVLSERGASIVIINISRNQSCLLENQKLDLKWSAFSQWTQCAPRASTLEASKPFESDAECD